MAYTFTQVTIEMVKLLRKDPTMKIEWKPHKNGIFLKLKEGRKYASGKACLQHMIHTYEAAYPNKVNWELFLYEIIQNSVRLPSSFNIL